MLSQKLKTREGVKNNRIHKGSRLHTQCKRLEI